MGKGAIDVDGGVPSVQPPLAAPPGPTSCEPDHLFSESSDPEVNAKNAAAHAGKLRAMGCYDVRTRLVPRQLEGHAFRVTVEGKPAETFDGKIAVIGRLIPQFDGIGAAEDVAELRKLQASFVELKAKRAHTPSWCGIGSANLSDILARIKAKIELPAAFNDFALMLGYLPETKGLPITQQIVKLNDGIQKKSLKEKIQIIVLFVNSHRNFFEEFQMGDPTNELLLSAKRATVLILGQVASF